MMLHLRSRMGMLGLRWLLYICKANSWASLPCPFDMPAVSVMVANRANR